jgi:hypothetical protein
LENRDNDRKKSGVKGFLAWVDGENDLDEMDSIEEEDDEESEDEEHHDDTEEDYDDDEDEKGEDDAPPIVEQESLVDYEGDDEFDYPDEIVVLEELESSEDNEKFYTDYTDSADSYPLYQDEVHMTTKEKRRMKRFRVFYLILSGVVALNVIGILLVTVNFLPPFGGADNPAVNEVYTRYVVDGVDETGALNIVSAVLYAYRSFDTLGEAFVLFTAAMGVILLLKEDKNLKEEKPRKGEFTDAKKM